MKKKKNFGILLYVVVIVILIKPIGSCLFQETCITIYVGFFNINFYSTDCCYVSQYQYWNGYEMSESAEN